MSCGSCKIFGGEKIKFPIDINLKVVIGSENSVETTKEQLVVIFNELKFLSMIGQFVRVQKENIKALRFLLSLNLKKLWMSFIKK